MEVFVLVLLDALVGGAVLWLAAKITLVNLAFSEAAIAAGVAAVALLVPSVGWILSVIVLFLILKKFTRASIWPDILLMVIVSRLVSFVAFLAFGGMQ